MSGELHAQITQMLPNHLKGQLSAEAAKGLDFSYTDSLRDHLALLKETVVANHVLPHRLRDEAAFDSVEKPDWVDAPKGQAYSSLYPMKKGVKT